jgi:hypothetical protein
LEESTYLKVDNINELDIGNYIVISMAATTAKLFDGEKLKILEIDRENKKIKVDLMLNLRAYVILKEEYPMVIPFIKLDNKNKNYRLVLEVNDPKPITRFVLGLLDEISILGSEAFLAHLKNFVSQLDPNNKMANTKLKK